MQDWAAVLASPHVLRVADACSTAEDAALGAALSGKGEGVVSAALDVCLQGIRHWQHGDSEVCVQEHELCVLDCECAVTHVYNVSAAAASVVLRMLACYLNRCVLDKVVCVVLMSSQSCFYSHTVPLLELHAIVPLSMPLYR
jgi:hypothetical protein